MTQPLPADPTPEQRETQELFNRLGGTITPDEIRGILEARNLGQVRALGAPSNGSSPPSLALDGADRSAGPQVSEPTPTRGMLLNHEEALARLAFDVKGLQTRVDSHGDLIMRINQLVSNVSGALKAFWGHK